MTVNLSNIRFECTACGHCCRFTGERKYVFVSHAEAERIVAHTGLSWEEATELDPKGRLSLKCLPEGEGMACLFLRDSRCSIYEVRPRQCRTFPFWPQHFESQEALAAVPCEGLGRGELIPVADVLARLRAAGLRTTSVHARDHTPDR